MSEQAYRIESRPAATCAGTFARRMPVLLLFAFVVASAPTAHAALYKWTDEHGIVHYSDKLPVEAVDRANSQLTGQGITVRRTEQARTVAQRVPNTESEAQKLREAERERVIAERRDRALIESYANEAEIDLAKSRAIATIDGQVQSAQALIAQISRRRKELDDRKATFAPRPVPGEIPREIETIDAEIGRQNEFIAGKAKESANVAARYEADKLRFRELKGATSGAIVTSSDGRYATNQPVGIELTSAH